MNEENQKPLTAKELQQYKEMEEEMEEDAKDDMMDDQQDGQAETSEYLEGYGPPDPEERHNSHTFLANAAFKTPDTLRVTNLDNDELGKPIFNVRFLLDMEDISHFWLDDLCKELEVSNNIAEYFREKIINITDSGMSKEGFTMQLNTTKNVNISRTRRKDNLQNLKGGVNKR